MFGKFNRVGRESRDELRTSTRWRESGAERVRACGGFGVRSVQGLGILSLVAAVVMTWGVGRAVAAAATQEASETAATSETGEAVESQATTETAEAVDAADPDETSPSATGIAALTAKERTGIEEMFVTGKRGTHDIQSLAESISSFTGTQIEDRGITDFNNLQYNVPNLFSGGGLVKVTLRGVGSEIVGPGTDPGFSVHVNGVFSARESTGLISYFDIDRVDVLRGPQGTLGGRNSTGGAINIVTKRPIYEYDSNAEIEYGRFEGDVDGLRTLGMLNIPLIDEKLAFRVAFLTQHDDGMMAIHSENNDQRLSDMGLTTVRASLRWEPRDDVTVDLIGSYLRNKHQGAGQKFDGDFFTPPTVPDIILPSPFSVPAWPGAGPGLNFDDERFGAALPNPKDPYEGTANEPQHQKSELFTATLLATWDAEQFRLDSITAFQLTNFSLHRDQDTSSLPIVTLDLTDKSRQISQEFLVNSTWDRAYNYTFGTIYQFDWTPITELYLPNGQNTFESSKWRLLPFSLPLTPGSEIINLVDGCEPLPVPVGCPRTKPVGEVRQDFVDALTEVENHVFGLYGHLSWEILDALTLGVGGRFSYTRRDWDGQTVAQNFLVSTNVFSTGIQILQKGQHQTADWMSGTWEVTVDYQLLDEHLLWASVGTGSRAGGFQFSEEEPFGAEDIFAVQAGVKNMFFDNRLMLNLTGFWYDWEDPQITGTENALPITTNAPSAISYGIELDWLALPIEALAFDGSFGWLEAFYNEDHFERDSTQQDYSEPDPTQRAKLVNLNGNRVPRSPRFTAAFGAQYTLDLGRYGTLTPRVDFYFRDKLTFRQYGNPEDEEHRYTRTDARLTWRSESEQWWAELYGRNLENNAIRTNQEILASIYRVHYHDQPIRGGFRVGYRYR